MMSYKIIATPLGEMLLLASPNGLRGAWFLNQKHYPKMQNYWVKHDSPTILKAETIILNYFKG
jgi:methylated-DNA-[protein]-cysteine S-methyltransferase